MNILIMRIEWLFMCMRVAEELNEEQIHISEKGANIKAMHRPKYNLCVPLSRKKNNRAKECINELM